MFKKRASITVLILALVVVLTACTGSPAATQTQAPTSTPTATPEPTAVPTPTPRPIPEILNTVYDYCKAHEAQDEYTVQGSIQEWVGEQYKMELVYDEASDMNGTAIILSEKGKQSLSIEFQKSSIYGMAEVCAPALIKSTEIAVARAVGEMQGENDFDDLVNDVVASYDEDNYSYVTYIGDYAFAFEPTPIYATILTVTNMEEYKSSIDKTKYSAATYADLNLQLNSGSKYMIAGKVLDYQSGQYENSFGVYQCKLATVELEDGNKITVTQGFENAPINIEIGSTYTFYGNTQFSSSGELLFYLDYVE